MKELEIQRIVISRIVLKIKIVSKLNPQLQKGFFVWKSKIQNSKKNANYVKDSINLTIIYYQIISD
jgi:hypothetical protein